MNEKKLDYDKDSINTVNLDKDNKVESVIFKDGNLLYFKDFIDLFKKYLRTICAGEVISWDDVYRFHNLTTAKDMEEYMDNVEQEGITKGSHFPLTRGQRFNVGVTMLIVIGFIIFVIIMLFLAGGS